MWQRNQLDISQFRIGLRIAFAIKANVGSLIALAQRIDNRLAHRGEHFRRHVRKRYLQFVGEGITVLE